MTAKEKATYLVDKYYNSMGCLAMDEAIICALIAVNEIIEQWEYVDIYIADLCGELNPNLKYWYEVKQSLLCYN